MRVDLAKKAFKDLYVNKGLHGCNAHFDWFVKTYSNLLASEVDKQNFDGNEEDYREVPQEDLNLKQTGDNWCEMQIEQPAIGVISSFNKWDRALTEKEISDLFSGKVRPEDIPQEAPKVAATGIEPTPPTPHAAERALWKAQREARTNEVWQCCAQTNVRNWVDLDIKYEPNWIPDCMYRVKPMKLTAKIIRRGVYKTRYYWEFTGTREEYRAECEKYGYVVVSEIKEVVEKPKTVKYYFAMLNRYRCTPFGRAASDKDQIIEYAKKHRYTIIGDIEEREIEV